MELDGTVLQLACQPTGWDLLAAIERVLSQLAGYAKATTPIAATGYGRALVPGAAIQVTEISCHAAGAEILSPSTAFVVDIGGQDTKAIVTDHGRPVTFEMNDRCAAGTGRFLEMALARLGMGLAELDQIGEVAAAPVKSICAVFAESEIISLLAQGSSRGSIAIGVARSLADKAAALACRISPSAPAILTGGLSECRLLAQALSEAWGFEVANVELGRYAGAIGAASLALTGRLNR
jgi:predicted CoA-substrate-specific enzyme activase